MSSFPSTTAHANDVYRFGPGSGFRTSIRWIRRLTRKRLFSVQSQYYRRRCMWKATSDRLSEACACVSLGHGAVGMGTSWENGQEQRASHQVSFILISITCFPLCSKAVSHRHSHVLSLFVQVQCPRLSPDQPSQHLQTVRSLVIQTKPFLTRLSPSNRVLCSGLESVL